MRFSLVLATVGRTWELERFLAALEQQTYQDIELIVVDQNSNNRLSSILQACADSLEIVHLRTDPGVSAARNLGLEHVSGDVVSFPDDDCWYPPDLLERVRDFLESRPEVDGISGRVETEGGPSYARFDKSPGDVTLLNAWRRTVTWTLFLRNTVTARVDGFDETLGANSGTAWGGVEDIDYALRIVRAEFRIHYDPSITVFHPNPLEDGYKGTSGRAYYYGAGIGHIWRKHGHPLWFVGYHLLRPLGGAALSLACGHTYKALYHWSAFRGRLRGWLSRG